MYSVKNAAVSPSGARQPGIIIFQDRKSNTKEARSAETVAQTLGWFSSG